MPILLSFNPFFMLCNFTYDSSLYGDGLNLYIKWAKFFGYFRQNIKVLRDDHGCVTSNSSTLCCMSCYRFSDRSMMCVFMKFEILLNKSAFFETIFFHIESSLFTIGFANVTIRFN